MSIIINLFKSVNKNHFMQFFPRIKKDKGRYHVTIKDEYGNYPYYTYFYTIEDFYEEFDKL